MNRGFEPSGIDEALSDTMTFLANTFAALWLVFLSPLWLPLYLWRLVRGRCP